MLGERHCVGRHFLGAPLRNLYVRQKQWQGHSIRTPLQLKYFQHCRFVERAGRKSVERIGGNADDAPICKHIYCSFDLPLQGVI